MNNKLFGDVVLDTEQISAGVEQVAAQLNERFDGDEVVVIIVVPGGILFAADLVRKLTFDIGIDTISCPHTPGDRQNRSPIAYHQNIDVTDKYVILVDDAIESGGTMKRLVEYMLTTADVRSLSVATLLVKPGRVDIPIPQYFAYEMHSDDLFVGYGLPWQDKYRNIPYISKIVLETG